MGVRPTRRLIWVPVVHTPADLGSLGGTVRDLHVRRSGADGWDRHVRAVEGWWSALEARVAALGLDPGRTFLYQDGLPVCGREEEIVRELAGRGSRNHRLLLELMGRGCRLVGTESPPLLLEEYRRGQALLSADRTAGDEGLRSLLQRRDAFLAARIADTLEPGCCGLLFLGLLHDLRGRLPPDVEVTRLTPARDPLPTGDDT